MTTPEQLYSKATETLKFLNSHLPNGSHVVLSGLPDGTFLWDNLHDRYHPLGIGLKIHLLFTNVDVCIVRIYIWFLSYRNIPKMPAQYNDQDC